MVAFSSYFQDWLYSDDGYYAKMPEIGKKGDFYTSVSASMFFGGSIANHILQTIDSGFLSKHTTIVEIGAHRGYLLADIIQFIFTLRPELLTTLSFAVVEPLEKVRIVQDKYFKSSFGDEVKVKIVKNIIDLSENEAFIVSNELFDSFACEVVHEDKMLFINNHEPHFLPINRQTKELLEFYGIKKGEVPLFLDEFAKELNHFERYKFVSFDYGQKEQREDFSLRVYEKHKTYPFFELTTFASKEKRLFEFFKKSDITYDVCFENLIKVFKKNGVKMERFCTQMVALNEFGITDLLEILRKNSDEKVYMVELEKAKQLILPNFLGERFKMISFKKF